MNHLYSGSRVAERAGAETVSVQLKQILTPHIARPRANARCAFPENDPALGQIIGCHFNMHPVAHDGADAEFPHLPRRVSDDPVIIFQDDAKATVRVNFVDHPFERKQLFFGQSLSRPPKD